MELRVPGIDRKEPSPTYTTCLEVLAPPGLGKRGADSFSF